MGRVRLLNPDIYMDEEIARLSMGARWLFAALWTIADREGRLEDLPNRIRAQVFPYEPQVDVESMLQELHTFLTRYEAEGKKCIQINSFLKHQKPHLRETSSRLPEPKANLGQTKANLGNAKVAGKVVDPVSDPVREQVAEEPPMPIPPGIRGDQEVDDLNAIWAEMRGGPHRYIHEVLGAVRIHGVVVVKAALRKYLAAKANEKFKGSPADFAANVLMYIEKVQPRPMSSAEVLRRAREM